MCVCVYVCVRVCIYIYIGLVHWVWLTGALRALVNGSFKKSFDITFMRNIQNVSKNIQNC